MKRLLAGMLAAAGLFTCARKENVLGNTSSQDTVVVRDTVRDTVIELDTVIRRDTVVSYKDTLWDTVVQEDTVLITLTVHDTLRVTAGKPKLTLVAAAIGYRNGGLDSVQASLAAYAVPYARSLRVRFGANAVPFLDQQELEELWRVPFGGWTPEPLDGSVFSSLAAANYGAVFPKGPTAFACTVLAPYYDTGGSVLAYDTLTDSIALPVPPDTLYYYHDDSAAYQDVDYFNTADTLRRIRLDRDLTVRWRKTPARWYAVEVLKYLQDFFGYRVVGAPLDTFTTDTQVVIPMPFLTQPEDTVFHADTSYTFLEIYVMAVNGPLPGERDTLADFEGSGFLYGLDYRIAWGDPTADPFYPPAAKRRAGVPEPLRPRPGPGVILSRILSRYGR